MWEAKEEEELCCSAAALKTVSALAGVEHPRSLPLLRCCAASSDRDRSLWRSHSIRVDRNQMVKRCRGVLLKRGRAPKCSGSISVQFLILVKT